MFASSDQGSQGLIHTILSVLFALHIKYEVTSTYPQFQEDISQVCIEPERMASIPFPSATGDAHTHVDALFRRGELSSAVPDGAVEGMTVLLPAGGKAIFLWHI